MTWWIHQGCLQKHERCVVYRSIAVSTSLKSLPPQHHSLYKSSGKVGPCDLLHHSPSLPWLFLPFFHGVSWCLGKGLILVFIAEHSTINYSNPAISYAHCNKTLIWPRLPAVIMYKYKHSLEGNLISSLCPSSKIMAIAPPLRAAKDFWAGRQDEARIPVKWASNAVG